MFHFVSNIHNYIMVEVLESGWKVFSDQIETAKDLDELIKYHQQFLDSILDKALLSPRYDEHMKQLKMILSQIHLFTHIEENHVFNPAIQKAEFLKEQKRRRKEGLDVEEDEDDSTALSEKACQQLIKTHKDFLNNFKDFKKKINIYVRLLTPERDK